MVTNAANKRLLSSYNSDEKILFNLIMDDHINNTSNTQATYDPVSHQMVYSMQSANGETVTMSMSDINRGLSAHDPKYLNNIAGKFTNVVTMAKNSKDGQMTADDAIRFKNDLNKSITSWDEIRNVSKELFGTMKYTFEEVLNGQAKDVNGNVDTTLIKTLYDELDAIGGIDMDGNNIINAADRDIYANPANAAILMDVLSKDKEKYKELMTGYLTETVVNDYYQQGVDQRPIARGRGSGDGGDETSTGFLSTKKGVYSGNLDRSFSYNVSKNMYDNMKLANEGKDANFLLGGTQYKYDPTKNNWTVGGEEFGDTNNLIKNLGISNDPDFKALLDTTSEITEQSTEEIVPKKKVERADDTYSNIPGMEDIINFNKLDEGDNAVVKSLNNTMPEAYTNENPEGYYWDEGTAAGAFGTDDLFTQSISLKDSNGNVVQWPEGHRFKGDIYIRTKGEYRKNAIKYIDEVLTLFGLAKNMKTGSNTAANIDTSGY